VASDHKQVQDAVVAVFETLAASRDARAGLNDDDAPNIPDGGLYVVRALIPGEPEEQLGREGPYYFDNVRMPVEAYGLPNADEDANAALLDDMKAAATAAIAADPTLGGLVFHAEVRLPTEEDEFGGVIEVLGTLLVFALEYQADTLV